MARRASESLLAMGNCLVGGACGSLRGTGGEGNEPISEIPVYIGNSGLSARFDHTLGVNLEVGLHMRRR
jgi:hypothetical protein